MLTQAVLKTIAYADVFDYPLTQGEIYRYLISSRPHPRLLVALTVTALTTSGHLISSLNNTDRVGESQIFYALPNRSHLFNTRRQRLHHSQKKLKITRNTIGEWVKKIPGLEAVFITGSLAMANCHPEDDIDLMIIAKTGKLWQTRALLTLILDRHQLRRKPETKHHQGGVVANKFCPNLYLDLNHLTVPLNQQNLYTAHEVAQARLLWQRSPVLDLFRFKNRWIAAHLPHSPLPHKPPPPLASSISTPKTSLETIFYRLQLTYMHSKRTRERVGPGFAYFHPRDTKTSVLDQYQFRLNQLNPSLLR